MAKRKRAIPQYGTVTLNGIEYYRTRVQNADGKLVALYARTPEELYDKELNALEQIDNDTFCRKSPTVAEYCERWLLMQSVHIRATTLTDYTSKVRRHIIKELGHISIFEKEYGGLKFVISKQPSIHVANTRSGFAWKQKKPINRDLSRVYRLCVLASGSLFSINISVFQSNSYFFYLPHFFGSNMLLSAL